MVVMNKKRRIELRIRGSHGPPSAEELALATLKDCCKVKSRALHRNGDELKQVTDDTCKSHVMAEITIIKYCPHG
jgi:hypothetical protein